VNFRSVEFFLCHLNPPDRLGIFSPNDESKAQRAFVFQNSAKTPSQKIQTPTPIKQIQIFIEKPVHLQKLFLGTEKKHK
jgi:hypothetical protein